MQPSTIQRPGRGVCHLSATDDLSYLPRFKKSGTIVPTLMFVLVPSLSTCCSYILLSCILLPIRTSQSSSINSAQTGPDILTSIESLALAEPAARWQPQPLPIQSPRPSLLRIPSLPFLNPMPRRLYTTTHNSLVDSISI